MGDVAGALELPVPTDDEPVGDPALSTLAGFFAAVLNAKASSAWGAVAPGESAVATTFTKDPSTIEFSDSNLPALFLWRSEIGEDNWIAQDWLVRPSTLQLLIAFRSVPSARQKLREPFANAIRSCLTLATEFDGREPTWVVSGDTDPLAATKGSLLWTFAGVHSLRFGKAAMRPLIIREIQSPQDKTGSAGRVIGTYRSFQMPIRIEERIVYDAATHADAHAYAEITMKNPTDPGGGIVTNVGRLTGS